MEKSIISEGKTTNEAIEKGLKQLNTIQKAKLQTLLKVKKSLQEISDELGDSRQTLYREILRNSYP